MRLQYITLFIIFFLSCTGVSALSSQSECQKNDLACHVVKLQHINSSIAAEVMVLATHHFSQKILLENNQRELQLLNTQLLAFKPTKIFVEWEPEIQQKVDKLYQQYQKGELSLKERHNEVFQLGFKLAKLAQLDKVYLLDDQTPFIGSLDGFSFEKLLAKAKQNDDGFYNRHESEIVEKFRQNQALYQSLSLFQQIALRNSPQAQQINSKRMHAYENRIGIQANWMGPDWLGRWYRRNVRMSSNVLKYTQNEDRVLIIVGDNHKWILDYLFAQMPEFTVKSSWELLSR